MQPREIANLTRAANEIGKAGYVVCRYEFDRVKKIFKWNFYRHGHWIGSANRPGDVISKATKFASTK